MRRVRDSMPLALLILLVALSSPAAQTPGEAQSSRGGGGGGLVGRITDARHDPVARADVSIVVGDSVIRYAQADANGAFEFTKLSSGRHEIVVRRLGFKVRHVDVDVASSISPTHLDVVLVAIPAELEQVRVEASIDESHGKLREFYEHRAHAQFGYFFGPENLERDKLRVTSEVMRRVPGARLIPARFGNHVQFRGCSPLIVIDGQRAVGAELDEITDPDDIAAIEVYPSMAGLPPQYVGMESRCGVIVVWTRVS